MTWDSMRNNRLFFLAAASVLLLDWLTKTWIRANIPLNGSMFDEWTLFRIAHVGNTGAAFGMFQDRSAYFVIVAVAAIGLILYYYRRLPPSAWLVRLALGLQLGGAIGNLIDRITIGHVTDFIDFRWWPVFNIADSAIVIGVIVLGYYLLFVAREERSEPATVSD